MHLNLSISVCRKFRFRAFSLRICIYTVNFFQSRPVAREPGKTSEAPSSSEFFLTSSFAQTRKSRRRRSGSASVQRYNHVQFQKDLVELLSVQASAEQSQAGGLHAFREPAGVQHHARRLRPINRGQVPFKRSLRVGVGELRAAGHRELQHLLPSAAERDA